MSSADETARDDGLIKRVFAADVVAGDGRTVDVRIVPFGERARCNDGLGGVERGVEYEEEWMPGVFDHQLAAANRVDAHVLANFEHERGIGGVVGHAVALHAEPDGYYGSFRMHETADGEKALMLIREQILGGVSLEAVPAKSVRTATGVVQRVKAHLRAIAFCRTPAFAGAQVLAVREEIPLILEEQFLPIDIDPELVSTYRQLGLQLPQRYDEAHPAQPGTPEDESGTPAGDTRQTEIPHTNGG